MKRSNLTILIAVLSIVAACSCAWPATAMQVAAGRYHTVAVKSDGTVWAWGENARGQLGDGTTTNRSTPVQVSGLAGVTGVAAGGRHTVALKSEGTVWAWGRNNRGQLGDGTTTDRPTPVQVSGLAGVTGVSAGVRHTVALKSDTSVCAWGQDVYGQLGDGYFERNLFPVQAHLDVVSSTGASISINGGAAYATSASVALALSPPLAVRHTRGGLLAG